jgi:VanZ family protein
MDLFAMKPEFYLNNIFKDNLGYENVLINEISSNLDILFSKPDHSSKIDLTSDANVKAFFDKIKSDYDFVIIDTPPALVRKDAFALGKFADAVIMVIKQEKESVKHIQEVQQTFEEMEIPIVGCILNDIKRRTGSEYSRKYAYSKKYYNNNGTLEGKSKKASLPRAKGLIARRAVVVLLILAVLLTVGYFATRTDIEIIQMSEVVVAKISDMTDYSGDVEYWGSVMEHYVHAFLFFFTTLVFLGLFATFSVKFPVALFFTLGISLPLSVGNEYFQSLYVEGRGFEMVDVAFGMVGMLVGIVFYILFKLLKATVR